MGDNNKDAIPCCHCVNIESSNIEKYFKAKCITDHCVKEDGKKYFKIQWEETWAREEDLENCTDLLNNYTKNGKPKVEVLSQTDNQSGERVLFVKVTAPPHLKEKENVAKTGLASIQGLDPQSLLDRVLMSGAPPCKQPFNPHGDDVKMITYAQLQKVGFHLDEEEANEENNANNNQTTPRIDHLEFAKQKMYSQIGTSLQNMKFAHYVHNDLESSRAQRRYGIRRRQPFQLYKCGICGSEFVHRTHLKIHQRTHTGEKPYKCSYCGRAFAQKGNLHVHMKIHTGEKDFVCEYCKRGFITNAQLFVHMRTHTNPNRKRPYATGRPPKSEDTENKGVGNQVVVQLVEPDDGCGGGRRSGSASPVIPPVESRQLENISEETEKEEARLKEEVRLKEEARMKAEALARVSPRVSDASVCSQVQHTRHVPFEQQQQQQQQQQNVQQQQQQHNVQQQQQQQHNVQQQQQQQHEQQQHNVPQQQQEQQQHKTQPQQQQQQQQDQNKTLQQQEQQLQQHQQQHKEQIHQQQQQHRQPQQQLPKQPDENPKQAARQQQEQQQQWPEIEQTQPVQVSQQTQPVQVQQPNLHTLVAADSTLRALAETGTEMIHILVAQQ